MLNPSLRAYGWVLPVIIALGTISSAAEAVGIGLFIPVLDPAYLEQGSQGIHLGAMTRVLAGASALFPWASRTFVAALVILLALLLKACLSYSNALLSARKNLQIGHELRSQMFSQLLNSGYAFVSRNDWGKLLDTLATETWRTTQALAAAISVITSSCTIVVFAALLLFISWQLTLAVAAGIALLSAALRLITRPVMRHGEEAVRVNGFLGERMVDGILGVRTIEAFNLQRHMRERFDRASDNVRAAYLRVEAWSSLVNPCADISSSLLLLVLLLVSVRFGTQWPVLVVMVMMIYRLQSPFKQLESARVSWLGLRGASLNVNDLLERTMAAQTQRQLPAGRVPFGQLKREIVFHDVSFSYPEAARASLRKVSVLIPQGSVTAIVGLSGAGKTTLLNLLCGLFQPSEGEIRVDGIPLHDIDPHTWRGRLALAGQDVHLFNTTVRENIRYGRLDATDAEILEAARHAHADEFVREFAEGYDAPVGDNGGRLSGGQRQRIALARAFLRNPDILILDEATNALDTLSEQLVQSALESLPNNRTVVIAAHRFSTIQGADQVIVLDHGEVVEQGSPGALRKQNGLFARLYDLQSAGVVTEIA